MIGFKVRAWNNMAVGTDLQTLTNFATLIVFSKRMAGVGFKVRASISVDAPNTDVESINTLRSV